MQERIVQLESLRQSRKNLVDRARLLELMPGATTGGLAASDAPRTATELALATAWKDILHIPHVGTRDNFFDQGGHSLLSIQMIARIARETGCRLIPRHVLLDTLGQLANRIDAERSAGASA